jgi:alpha-tubulin suppressor-like RCC1 family protein
MSACSSTTPSTVELVGVLPQSATTSQVASVRVSVSAPDLPYRTHQLSLSDGQWRGSLTGIPAGSGRTFLAQALDAGGNLLFQGQAANISLLPGQTALIAMTLQEASPPPPFQNSTPRITSLLASASSVEPGGLLALQATAMDPDSGDTLTVQWSAHAGTFSNSLALATSWLAPATPGDVPLQLLVTDSQGAATSLALTVSVRTSTASADVRVSFNTWPRVTRMTAQPATVAAGEATTLTASVVDADGDPILLDWSASCEGDWLNVTPDSIQFRPRTPPFSEACTRCALTVTAMDARGGRGTGELSLCIGRAAAASFPPVITEAYQDSASLPASGTLTVRVSARDPQGSALSFSWQASHGTTTPAAESSTSSQVAWALPACASAGLRPSLTATVTNALGQSTTTTFHVLDMPTCRWVSLTSSARGDHVLALRSDGTVWAWGANQHGQLGDGTTQHRHTPAQVSALQRKQIKAVAVGWAHSLAVDAQGNVWSWGNNWTSQLGAEVSEDRPWPAPVAFPSGVRIKSLVAGHVHSLALAEDGSVWAWGNNGSGQLGTGDRLNRSAPVRISALDARGIVALGAGMTHSLARGADGVLWVWGANEAGQVGDGTLEDRLTPIPVLAAVSGMAAGPGYSLALRSDGRLWHWGSSMLTGQATSTPTRVEHSDLVGVVQITSGEVHALALLADGSVVGMGRNRIGQLTGNTHGGCNLVCRLTMPARVVGLSATNGTSMALMEDGSVWAWGNNSHGQLGNGSMAQRGTPLPVPGLTGIRHAAAGNAHSIVARSDGSVWSWGTGSNHRHGSGVSRHRPVPERVGSLENASKVFSGGHYALTLLQRQEVQEVWGWGANWEGQLGNEPRVKVLPTHLRDIQERIQVRLETLAVGLGHTLALDEQNSVWAWGNNDSGQLGDGTTENKNSPVLVPGLPATRAISAGYRSSMALDVDGSVWTWGDNSRGLLGDGTTVARALPARISIPARITAIAAGRSHSLALDEDGFVWGWGANYHGQLGDGTQVDKLTPVRNPFLSNIVQIAAGDGYSVARRRDGATFAWGYNYYSQVGDHLGLYQLTPLLKSGSFTKVFTSATASHTLALDADGRLWVWGSNTFGQFGNGESGLSPVPVRTLLP